MMVIEMIRNQISKKLVENELIDIFEGFNELQYRKVKLEEDILNKISLHHARYEESHNLNEFNSTYWEVELYDSYCFRLKNKGKKELLFEQIQILNDTFENFDITCIFISDEKEMVIEFVNKYDK